MTRMIFGALVAIFMSGVAPASALRRRLLPAARSGVCQAQRLVDAGRAADSRHAAAARPAVRCALLPRGRAGGSRQQCSAARRCASLASDALAKGYPCSIRRRGARRGADGHRLNQRCDVSTTRQHDAGALLPRAALRRHPSLLLLPSQGRANRARVVQLAPARARAQPGTACDHHRSHASDDPSPLLTRASARASAQELLSVGQVASRLLHGRRDQTWESTTPSKASVMESPPASESMAQSQPQAAAVAWRSARVLAVRRAPASRLPASSSQPPHQLRVHQSACRTGPRWRHRAAATCTKPCPASAARLRACSARSRC